MEIWLGRWELLTLNLNPLKFGGNKFCKRGYTMFAICYKTSHDHVREAYELMDESLSPLVTNLPNLLVVGLAK